MSSVSDLSIRQTEVQNKLTLLRARLSAQGYDGIKLNHSANTAWISAGAATYVNEATDGGAATILVTHDGAYALTDGIEAPRLEIDEHLGELGFEFRVKKWHSAEDLSATLTAGKRIATDSDFGADLLDLRTTLTSSEIIRFRKVGQNAAAAMHEAIQHVQPGDTEYRLAGYLAGASRLHGGSPIVTLIASDARIYRFRHPLPTAKTVEKYAMLVLCFRQDGLVASITRLVHFGPIPADLAARAATVAHIDGLLINSTQPGKSVADLFEVARSAYAEYGYPSAIDEHHQGGSAGYNPREVIATPHSHAPVKFNQAFAWNPSVSGSKSEDTVLITENGPEVITAIEAWPVTHIEAAGRVIPRPQIWER